MKKITTKGVICIVLVLIVLGFITLIQYFNISINGSKQEKAEAFNRTQAYINENYSDLDLVIDEPTYSSKLNVYRCNIHSNAIGDLHFTVEIYGDHIWDNYESRVLGGNNTMERMSEEYTVCVDKSLSKEFGELYDRVDVRYMEEKVGNYFVDKLDEPLDMNDGIPKELSLHLVVDKLKIELLSENLRKLNDTVIANGYDIEDYLLWIENKKTRDMISITHVKANSINSEFLNAINQSLYNTEAFEKKYGAYLTVWVLEENH